jgi:hypothetical protein
MLNRGPAQSCLFCEHVLRNPHLKTNFLQMLDDGPRIIF